MHCNTHHAKPGEKNCAGWRHIAQNQKKVVHKTQKHKIEKGTAVFLMKFVDSGQWSQLDGHPITIWFRILTLQIQETTFQLSCDTDKCLPGSGRGAGGWDKTAFPVTKTKIRRPCLKCLVNRPKDGAVGKTEISYTRPVQKFYINQTWDASFYLWIVLHKNFIRQNKKEWFCFQK